MSRTSAALLLAAAIVGCTPEQLESLFGSVRTNAPVYFIRAEGLEPPLAGNLPRVYKPAALFAAPAAQESAPQVFMFQVVLAVRNPTRVEMRLVDALTGARTALERTAPPQSTGGMIGPSDAAATLLAAGRGAFWFEGAAGSDSQYRFGVTLPASALTPDTRLEMYADRAEDGTPIGLDSFELAPDFCYLAVIGDSVLWGNGLENRDKISSRVARVLERELGRRVVTQMLAQSGATIVPGPDDGVCAASCNGEVPFVPTSITTQVGLIERPDLVEVVIMDGCANDISIATILSPQTTDAEMESLAAEFCDAAMRELLAAVRARLPSAAIVVTGYYPFVTDESSTLGLSAWEITRGVIGSDGEIPLASELTHQSELFVGLTSAYLAAAVAATQAEAPDSRIGFVEPRFGAENAAFASEAWLWGVTSDNALFEDLNLIQALNLDLFPEDPVQSVRVQLCADPSNTLTLLECLYASVGHPNPRGSESYAVELVAKLRELGILPASP